MTSRKGLILLCLLFLASGIYMVVVGISAMKTGALIHNLSPTHAFQGYEAVFCGMVSILAGAGGVWAVLRKPK